MKMFLWSESIAFLGHQIVPVACTDSQRFVVAVLQPVYCRDWEPIECEEPCRTIQQALEVGRAEVIRIIESWKEADDDREYICRHLEALPGVNEGEVRKILNAA